MYVEKGSSTSCRLEDDETSFLQMKSGLKFGIPRHAVSPTPNHRGGDSWQISNADLRHQAWSDAQEKTAWMDNGAHEDANWFTRGNSDGETSGLPVQKIPGISKDQELLYAGSSDDLWRSAVQQRQNEWLQYQMQKKKLWEEAEAQRSAAWEEVQAHKLAKQQESDFAVAQKKANEQVLWEKAKMEKDAAWKSWQLIKHPEFANTFARPMAANRVADVIGHSMGSYARGPGRLAALTVDMHESSASSEQRAPEEWNYNKSLAWANLYKAKKEAEKEAYENKTGSEEAVYRTMVHDEEQVMQEKIGAVPTQSPKLLVQIQGGVEADAKNLDSNGTIGGRWWWGPNHLQKIALENATWLNVTQGEQQAWEYKREAERKAYQDAVGALPTAKPAAN
jgi:hypothetical protein